MFNYESTQRGTPPKRRNAQFTANTNTCAWEIEEDMFFKGRTARPGQDFDGNGSWIMELNCECL